MTHSSEGTLDGVRRAQVLPVLGGEVVEGEQRVAILVQAICGFVVFQLVAFDEGVEGRLGLTRVSAI